MFKSTRKMVLVASAVMLFGYCGGTNKAFAFTEIINPSEIPIVQSVNTAKVKCELGINNLNYAAVTGTGDFTVYTSGTTEEGKTLKKGDS